MFIGRDSSQTPKAGSISGSQNETELGLGKPLEAKDVHVTSLLFPSLWGLALVEISHPRQFGLVPPSQFHIPERIWSAQYSLWTGPPWARRPPLDLWSGDLAYIKQTPRCGVPLTLLGSLLERCLLQALITYVVLHCWGRIIEANKINPLLFELGGR